MLHVWVLPAAVGFSITVWFHRTFLLEKISGMCNFTALTMEKSRAFEGKDCKFYHIYDVAVFLWITSCNKKSVMIA